MSHQDPNDVIISSHKGDREEGRDVIISSRGAVSPTSSSSANKGGTVSPPAAVSPSNGAATTASDLNSAAGGSKNGYVPNNYQPQERRRVQLDAPTPQVVVSEPDGTLPRLRTLPVQEFLVHKSHRFVIGFSILSLLILVGAWTAAVEVENGGKLHRRHVASILAFIFQFVTTLLLALVIRIEPSMMAFYVLQGMAVLTLFLTSISMGMNDVVVDLCASGTTVGDILCPAHTAEFFACLFVCLAMMVVFGATQQRIAMLVDKGILVSIRGRMTQL